MTRDALSWLKQTDHVSGGEVGPANLATLVVQVL